MELKQFKWNEFFIFVRALFTVWIVEFSEVCPPDVDSKVSCTIWTHLMNPPKSKEKGALQNQSMFSWTITEW